MWSDCSLKAWSLQVFKNLYLLVWFVILQVPSLKCSLSYTSNETSLVLSTIVRHKNLISPFGDFLRSVKIEALYNT